MPNRHQTTAPSRGRFVSYLRVSTARQGADGLGIEAQRQAVASYVASGELLAEYVEQESGRRNDRPKLLQAMEHCRLSGARLVIAKLDRLSRNAAFLISLRDAGIDFVAADMPQADRFTVGILALVAEREREVISERTKAALAAAKTRGTKLGNPNGATHLMGRGNSEALQALKSSADARAETFRNTLEVLATEGIRSAHAIARAFNERGFPSPRGSHWTATGVLRLQRRIAALVSPNR